MTPKKYLIASICWTGLFFAGWAEAQIDPAAEKASQEFYERAVDELAENKLKAAEILLRNSLQQNPENLPARIALGTTVSYLGQYKLAVSELEEALRLGGDENLILPPLARSYISLVQPENVITKVLPKPSHQFEVAGEVYLARAQAYLMLGAADEAGDAYVEASVRLPADHRPMLGLARIAIIEGKISRAMELFDKATELNPSAADAWAAKATAMRDLRQYRDAMPAYQRAIELNPDVADVYASRAAMWMDLGQYERARKDVAEVKRIGDDNLQVIYIESLLLFSEGKVDEARARLRETAKNILEIPDDLKDKLPNTRLMLGIVAYFEGNYDAALKELRRYLDSVPSHTGARRYLASTYLALQDWDNVIRTYQSGFQDALPRDPVALSLLAEAYRRKGRYKRAEEVYEAALAISPNSAGLALRLAQSRIDLGNVEQAKAEIIALHKRFPDLLEAGAQLARVHVRLGEIDDALNVAQGMALNHPESARARLILGANYMAAQRLDEAEQAMIAASRLDPGMIQPRLNLGRLAVRKGNLASAESQFRTVLAAHPKDLSAGAELVKLLLRKGEIDEARQRIDEMLSLAPKDLSLRVLKLKVDLREAPDQASANAIIFDFGADFQRSPRAMSIAARAYMAFDDFDSAKVYFRRAAEFAGYDEPLLLSIGAGQVQIKDYEAALWSVEKAISANPNNHQAISTKVNLLRVLNELDRADETLAQIPAEMRAEYPILMAEARVLRSREDYAGALAGFTKASQVRETAEVRRAVFQMQRQLGENERAYADLAKWTSENPRDVTSRHLLGDSYLRDKRYEQAKFVYEGLINDNYRSVVALNNLATVYHRLGDERALNTAAQAYELAKENPQVIDTYGWILTENGQADKALPLLREAYARSATNPTIRYHIALSLARLGRHEQAAQELRATLATGQEFNELADARALLKQLEGG